MYYVVLEFTIFLQLYHQLIIHISVLCVYIDPKTEIYSTEQAVVQSVFGLFLGFLICRLLLIMVL